MIGTAQRRAGFTLIEILAVILVLAVGMAAVIALAAMGRRWAGEAQARFTGASTAFTVLYDPAPVVDPTATLAWTVSGAFAWTGSYALRSQGTINGFWVRREEVSAVDDIIDAQRRWAWVTVEVFWGMEGQYITTVRERIQRAGAPP